MVLLLIDNIFFFILVNDVCLKVNGGCSIFCLFIVNSCKCVCFDGVKLLLDRKICDGGK